MALRQHATILWRYRVLVVTGLLLGITFAVLAVAKVTTTGIHWRAQQTYSSESTLFVTQKGFPEGRVVLEDGSRPAIPATPEQPEGTPAKNGTPFADPGRFSNLAIVYSYIAQSDRVRALIRPRPKARQVTVTPVTAVTSAETLPILKVETNAPDAARAKALNSAAVAALRNFLETEQRRSDIPSDNRVRLEVLNPPSRAKVLVGRSKTPAIVAFLLAMVGAVALAYCLENLRTSGGGGAAAGRRDEPEGEPPLLEEVWPAAHQGPSRTPSRQAS